MSRSILIPFFVLFLVTINIRQIQGLAAFFHRVRNKTRWGKLRKIHSSRDVKSCTQVQVVTPRKISTEESTLSIPNLSQQTDLSFDVDVYRQEMTDLVYQRGMQRMCTS
mmetsp:Transcript_24725/g.58058  ORF Transcript_24725/g.58058 Transcript_24725/m.58058 type:complete len:109 (-) Transcript_24725:133-459(-)